MSKGFLLFLVFILITAYSFSQTAAYLDFKNPVLESGNAGADGAQYRFSYVTGNVDALVTISGRSDSLVNILNTDMNTSGFDGAFQPQVGYNNGTTPGAADWWMEFNIQFVDHGTTSAVSISEFNVSGVDIDGNGQYINEYISFFDMQDYSLETNSGLTVTSLNEMINGTMKAGKRFDGPVANYTNIDTSATLVMVSNHYVNKSSFNVRTGGRSTDVSGAADRMYSFYFQNFTYNTPLNSLLNLRQPTQRVRRDTDKQLSMSSYPNPVINHLNIIVPSFLNNQVINASIYDMNGKIVKQCLHNLNSKIELGDLKTGIYVIQVEAGHEKYIQKIVKL